jgi:hypothetical protein
MGKMVFDRWSPAFAQTWSFRLLMRHQTEINNMYWAHQAAMRKAFECTKGASLSGQCLSFFTMKSGQSRHLPSTLKEWAHEYNAFDNWTRLSSLVSATGYIEVFIKTMVRLALESDPGVIVGCSRKIDGTDPLKNQLNYTFKDEASTCAKGEWQSRIASYKKYFGICPTAITDHIQELEFIRRTRNGVAHTFGRGIDDYDLLAQAKPRKLITLNENRFLKYLGIIEEVAKGIESHLAPQHIGDYESVYHFHRWVSGKRCEDANIKLLKCEFANMHGSPIGKQYCKDLWKYYESI